MVDENNDEDTGRGGRIDATFSQLARRLLATTLAIVMMSIYSFISDTSQIVSLVVDGGPQVIWVGCVVAAMFVGIIIAWRRRANNHTFGWAAVRMATVALSAFVVMFNANWIWPETSENPDRARVEVAPLVSTPTSQRSAPSTTISAAPVRTREMWAADINAVCRHHLTEAGISIDAMHRTDNNLKALAQKYDILDPAQREQYLAEFTNDIEKMRTSMTSLNMAYLVINDSAASIALPSNASDRSAAQSWRERYKNRAHMFSGLLESFDEFLQEEGRLSQAWSLIKTAGSSQTFGYVNDDVLNEGENIGIVSCP